MAQVTASLIVLMRANFKDVIKGLDSVSKRFDKTGRALSQVGATMSRNLTLPFVAAVGASIKSAADFDTAFTGVKKTVVASESEFNALADSVKNLATQIPHTTSEISRVMEVSGQLGVKLPDLENFAKVMLEIGVSSENLNAEEAALQLAQFMNVTRVGQEDVRNLGDAIITLGNKFPALEPQIIATATRMSTVANLSQFAADEILGFATAAVSSGLKAELAGSALIRLSDKISVMANEGGKKLELFAQLIDKPIQATKELIQADPAHAIELMLTGLSGLDKATGETTRAMAALGITEVRLKQFVGGLTGAHEVLTEALFQAKEGFKGNGALAAEAGRRYATFSSKLVMLQNSMNNLGIILGDVMIPLLLDLIPKVAAAAIWFGDLDPAIQKTTLAVGGLIAALGPLVFISGQLVITGGALMKLLPALSATVAVLGAAFTGLVNFIGITLLNMSIFVGSGSAVGVMLEGLALTVVGSVGAIAGLIAAVVAVIAAFAIWPDEMMRVVKTIGSVIFDFFVFLGEVIASGWSQIVGLTKELFPETYAVITLTLGVITDTIISWINTTITFWGGLWDEVLRVTTEKLGWILEKIEIFVGLVKEKFELLQGVFDTTVEFWANVWDGGGKKVQASVKETADVVKKELVKSADGAVKGLGKVTEAERQLALENLKTKGSVLDLSGALEKGGKSGDTLSKAMEKLSTSLAKTNSSDKFPALAKNIQEIIRSSKDADAELMKLGEQFVKTGGKVSVFTDLVKEVQKDEKELAESTKELTERFQELAGIEPQLTATGKTLQDLLGKTTQANAAEMSAAMITLRDEFIAAGGSIDEFNAQLDLAGDKMAEATADANKMASEISAAFSQIASNAGAGDYSGMIGDVIGGIFGGGTGTGGGGGYGDLLGGVMDMFGGGSGGSSGGGVSGSMMSGIGSMFGYGAGESAGFTSMLGGTEAGPLMESGAFYEGGAGAGEMIGGSAGYAGYIGLAPETVESIGKLGDDTESSFEAGGQLVGMAIGAYFGGPAGAALGSMIGGAAGAVLGDFFGGGPGPGELARMAGENFFNTLFEQKGGLSFGNAETGESGVLDSFSFDALGDFEGLDNAEFSSLAIEKFGADVAGAFGQVGEMISDSLNLEEELGTAGAIGSLIGVQLAEDLGGSFVAIESLLDKMGTSAGEMMDQQIAAAEAGEQSWFEAQVAVQNLSKITENGIQGAQNFTEAFHNLQIAGDRGKTPLLALQKLAGEFLDDGINDINAAHAALQATGEFTDGELSTIFTAFAQRGITTMEQLASAGTAQLGAIIADANVLGNTFAGSIIPAEKMKEVLSGVIELADAIPAAIHTSVDIDVNIKETVERVIEETTSGGTEDSGEYARGGVVTGRSFGLVAESGPEAILPLSRSGDGTLGVEASGGGGGGDGMTFNIDARGAAPGVENQILSALEGLEQRAIDGAIDSILDQAQRGGRFGDIFER